MTAKKVKTTIYSVRVSADGEEKVLTLRVGDMFTEMSLMKNGRLVEVIREENNQIRFEKMK
jgi:hypothetical protein